MVLDKRDMKIITLLSSNARLPNNTIGKTLHISGETANSRINKLLTKQFIKGFKLGINYALLGYEEYDVYIRLKNYSEKDLSKIIKELCANKLVSWVASCFGKYDLRLSLISAKREDFADFIEQLEIKQAAYIERYEIVQLTEKYKTSQTSLLSKLLDLDKATILKLSAKGSGGENPHLHNFIEHGQAIELDDKDKTLLSILSIDPRASLVHCAAKIGITAEAVKYKMKDLEKKGVIRSYSAIANASLLGKMQAVFLFKLRKNQMKEMISFIASIDNVTSFVKLFGAWNFSVSIFASDVQEIHNTLMSFRNTFPEAIIDYEMLLLFETYKYPQLPEVVYEK
ncbi:Lrp/AsnC family transcriptional regulator [Candidatus Woesearchaeota archaeon]|nr:Lrp/AsnC family transcriptional regulator [Nanoarchaeota archaeon]MCB9370736.1 Lrp/AsnC family transcriptional regulator [Candidatus Woesearchaeota archaeon]USN43812.1 MAG: Lrp/AsnC family transcriptional regulator [Candidatus Woesearchaeota archaeon]